MLGPTCCASVGLMPLPLRHKLKLLELVLLLVRSTRSIGSDELVPACCTAGGWPLHTSAADPQALASLP